MKFVEDFKHDMCYLIRFFREVKKDFIPAYKALRHGRLRVSPLKKSKIMHRAGGYAYLRLFERLLWVVMIIGIIVGAFIGVALIKGDIFTFLLFLILLIPLPILFYQSDNYLIGHLGERVVAEELEKLGRQQWRIFHGLKAKDGDIDHIIVCKQGVFCVETKALRKKTKAKEEIDFEDNKIFINKKPLLTPNPIKQAKDNAKWLYYLINDHCYKSKEKKFKFVIPIITFPGWWVNSVFNETIVVCNPKQISDVFKNRKDTLSDDEFNNICKFLEEKNQIDLSDVK